MEVNRTFGTATTLYFPLIDAGAADFESTPVTHATGDTQVLIDTGSFANTGTGFSHEGNGIYSLPLTAAEMSGTVITVTIIDQGTKAYEDQSVMAFTGLGAWVEGGKSIIIGEVETGTFTATTAALEGHRLSPNTTEEATDDHYNGRLITFTSGVLLGQQSDITDYTSTNGQEKITYSLLTDAPSDGDRYIIT